MKNGNKSQTETTSYFSYTKFLGFFCFPVRKAYNTLRPATQLEKELKHFDVSQFNVPGVFIEPPSPLTMEPLSPIGEYKEQLSPFKK